MTAKKSDSKNNELVGYHSPNNRPVVEHPVSKAECAWHWEGADLTNTIGFHFHMDVVGR
jgi:hypothetical protein